MRHDGQPDDRHLRVSCPWAFSSGRRGVVRCDRSGEPVHVGVCLVSCRGRRPPRPAESPTAPPEFARRRLAICMECDEFNGNICERGGGCRCSFHKNLRDAAGACPLPEPKWLPHEEKT